MSLGHSLALGGATGLALGAVFFGGLLWTVRRVPHARRPWLLLVGSMLVRVALVLGGLLLLAKAGSIAAVGTGLIGLVAARAAVARTAAADDPSPPSPHRPARA